MWWLTARSVTSRVKGVATIPDDDADGRTDQAGPRALEGEGAANEVLRRSVRRQQADRGELAAGTAGECGGDDHTDRGERDRTGDPPPRERLDRLLVAGNRSQPTDAANAGDTSMFCALHLGQRDRLQVVRGDVGGQVDQRNVAGVSRGRSRASSNSDTANNGLSRLSGRAAETDDGPLAARAGEFERVADSSTPSARARSRSQQHLAGARREPSAVDVDDAVDDRIVERDDPEVDVGDHDGRFGVVIDVFSCRRERRTCDRLAAGPSTGSIATHVEQVGRDVGLPVRLLEPLPGGVARGLDDADTDGHRQDRQRDERRDERGPAGPTADLPTGEPGGETPAREPPAGEAVTSARSTSSIWPTWGSSRRVTVRPPGRSRAGRARRGRRAPSTTRRRSARRARTPRGRPTMRTVVHG